MNLNLPSSCAWCISIVALVACEGSSSDADEPGSAGHSPGGHGGRTAAMAGSSSLGAASTAGSTSMAGSAPMAGAPGAGSESGGRAGAENGGATNASGASVGGASGEPNPSSGGGGMWTAGQGGSSTNAGAPSAGSMSGSAGASSGSAGSAYVPISFGTKLDPAKQIVESKMLAQSLANPASPSWRAKGDQRRTYRFAEANADVNYRVAVPTNWDGASALPLVMFLHGAGNDESSYLDQNDKQMVTLANQHGYVLVSPLGHGGAYGTFLRLPADFSRPEEAAPLLAMRTPQSERTQELSEKDVINVLEIVLNEYPIDQDAMFLMGHSMGSGGTWYIGAKYSSYWSALAPMSGPFVLENGYPWENLRHIPVFVTEGLSAATVQGSRAVRDWMTAEGFEVTYKEVNADHPGMVPLVLPDVFDFFDDER